MSVVFPRIVFGSSMHLSPVSARPHRINDCLKLTSIDQWGSKAWKDLSFALGNCNYINYNETDVPDLTLGPSLIQIAC